MTALKLQFLQGTTGNRKRETRSYGRWVWSALNSLDRLFAAIQETEPCRQREKTMTDYGDLAPSLE